MAKPRFTQQRVRGQFLFLVGVALLAAFAVCLSIGTVAAQAIVTQKDDTIRVDPPSNGSSFTPAVSSNGRYVAFATNAQLDSRDTNSNYDVYVRDLAADTVTLVSVNVAGEPSNANSLTPSISGDGSKIAFVSYATNLVLGDTLINSADIFLRDLVNKTTILVSRSSDADGGVLGNSLSFGPSISADGRFVAFDSQATNLVPSDTNFRTDVFIRDLAAEKTTLISRGKDGVLGNNGSSDPSVSGDGSFVSFTSNASNLDPADVGFQSDVFVRNIAAGTTSLVSRASAVDGGLRPADGDGALKSKISENGQIVVFHSSSPELVRGDANSSSDIFSRDLGARTTTLISKSTVGIQGNSSSVNPVSSSDGRFVAFTSSATNLLANATTGVTHLFLRDNATGVTTLVSRSSGADGTQGNSISDWASISGDGRYVGFHSSATSLVPLGPAEPLSQSHIYLRDTTGPPAIIPLPTTVGAEPAAATLDPTLRTSSPSSGAGKATLSGPRGCSRKSFKVTASGTNVEYVLVYLDSTRIARLVAKSNPSKLSMKIKVKQLNKLRRHSVRAKVFFSRESDRKPVNLHYKFRRCR